MKMKPRKESTCKKYGVQTFIQEGSGNRWRCKKCRSEAVSKRRRKVKRMAVEYKGGECVECGYDACIGALEFHHLDPNEKDFSIGGQGNTPAWDKVKDELDKCVLLCANCHRELHYNLLNEK